MISLNDIKIIYVDNLVKNHPKVLKIISKLKDNTKIKYITSIADVPSHYFDNEKKKSIILTNQKGKFIKKCPCTPKYLGCDYYVVELSVGCLYDCTYCYLQEYQNIFATTFYVNFEDMFKEFDELLNSNPDKLFRIGFGEYADSLFLDDILNYTTEISQYLAEKKYSNYLIEYKTKTNNIQNILKFTPTKKEVIGWTMNALKISQNEEKFAADFEARLQAMKECASKGYFVAVHFDPVIEFDGWQEEYQYVINRIFQEIDKNKIIWISIGSLRFNPNLKPIIEFKHPDSKIVYNEMIKGADNKMRYFKSKRLNLYREIVRFIKQNDENAFVYFCMEDEEVWKDVLKINVKNNDEIAELFVKRLYNLTHNFKGQ